MLNERDTAAVHPRVCGERISPSTALHHGGGSSPRVRGTVSRRRIPAASSRFIPACAGNGLDGGGSFYVHPVHPRVCGERLKTSFVGPPQLGSSPRVRGTGRASDSRKERRRFIPACAGNGACAPGIAADRPVHPRVCGERRERVGYWEGGIGSSPRVRGTEYLQPRGLDAGRFIPACAGNGRPCRSAATLPTVHPRVCGERIYQDESEQDLIGSSPRVRGTDLSG